MITSHFVGALYSINCAFSHISCAQTKTHKTKIKCQCSGSILSSISSLLSYITLPQNKEK